MTIRVGIAIALLSAAAAPAVRAEVRVEPGRMRNAYALVVDDNWRTGCSVAVIEALHDRFQGDFLWVRRSGKAYVVRDPGRLAEAQALFEAGNPEWQALRTEIRSVERRERALDRECDRAEEESDALADAGMRDDTSDRRLDELEVKREALRSEVRDLDERERELDHRIDALERAAEAKLWKLADRWIADGTAKPAPVD